MALLPFSKTLILKTKCIANICKSLTTVRNLMSKQLVYTEFGDPVRVVRFRECNVPALGNQEVLVRMLAAPVNPADINTIQGTIIL